MLFRRTFSHRTFALALATILTLGPVLALHFRTQGSATKNSPERISYLTLLQSPPEFQERIKAPNREMPRQRIGSSKVPKAVGITSETSASINDKSTSEATQLISDAKAEAPEGPHLPASAPIKIDLATIRAANRASKSAVRNMAETSGTYFGDEPSSQSEKLSGAIARTAKEDCLGPNAGGSLLSIFVIPYMAATGKCK